MFDVVILYKLVYMFGKILYFKNKKNFNFNQELLYDIFELLYFILLII